MDKQNKIILASGSPRRKELLASLGLSFSIIPSQVDETVPDDWTPAQVVEALSERKASDVAQTQEQGLVIGSDTIVVLDGQVLGKPRDEEEAFAMLTRLQGREHEVYSGLAIIDAATGETRIGHNMTKVKMKLLSPEKVKQYIASGEPMDKAGSYAIQGLGATLIERMEGDYFNVVGLSVSMLADYLEQFGQPVLK